MGIGILWDTGILPLNLFHSKENQNDEVCVHMDENGKSYTEWGNPGPKGQMVDVLFYMWMLALSD